MKKIKIAFDVHGVITSDPEKYRKLMKALVDSELFEVWVISGPRVIPVLNELAEYDIMLGEHFHEIRTIVEYLLGQTSDFRVEYDEDLTERYYFDEWEWNTAKADICCENDIHILIDDTKEYQKYFEDSETLFFLKE